MPDAPVILPFPQAEPPPPSVREQLTHFARLACQHVLMQICSGSFWANLSLLAFAGMSQIPADVLANDSRLRVGVPVVLAILGFLGKGRENHAEVKHVCS